MWEIWVHFAENKWKMVAKTDSYTEAEDILLGTYLHREQDFLSVSMYDRFDNRHMYIDKSGKIEQVCRVKWLGQERDNNYKD